MTTTGKSRLAKRFAMSLNLVDDTLPKLRELIVAVDKKYGGACRVLEDRIFALEERTLRRRVERAWAWIWRRNNA